MLSLYAWIHHHHCDTTLNQKCNLRHYSQTPEVGFHQAFHAIVYNIAYSSHRALNACKRSAHSTDVRALHALEVWAVDTLLLGSKQTSVDRGWLKWFVKASGANYYLHPAPPHPCPPTQQQQSFLLTKSKKYKTNCSLYQRPTAQQHSPHPPTCTGVSKLCNPSPPICFIDPATKQTGQQAEQPGQGPHCLVHVRIMI